MPFEPPIALDKNKKTPSMRARSAQAKGARGEREVLQAIRDVMINVETDLINDGHNIVIRSEHAVRRRLEIGKSREDISGVPLISIEVKRNESLNVGKAWEQAIRQSDKGRMPVLIYKYSREPWIVRTWVALPSVQSVILMYVPADMCLPDFLRYYAALYRTHLLEALG